MRICCESFSFLPLHAHSKTMSQKLPASTSTPFTPFITSYHDSEDLDSGYLSGLSNQSKSCSTQTPDSNDNILGNVSIISAEHEKVVPNTTRAKYFRPSLIQTDHVDFLYHLGERSSHSVILRKIFEHVNNEDLYNATKVSRTWKKVIFSIPVLRKKCRLFAREVQLSKENRMVRNNDCYGLSEEKSAFSPRSTLTEIQNKRLLNSNSPHSSSSTATWSPNYRFEAFQIEAQRLKIGKRLHSCPKCKLPSQVDEKELTTAVCTSQFCRYRFCILCHCEAHPSKVCSFISTPMVRKQMGSVGSKSSKRNLKRLLL